MNGYLSGHAIGRELAKLAAEFVACGGAETFNVNSLTGRVSATVERLRQAAIVDIDEVAVEVVSADALANNPLNTGTWHKVRNIKDVRERTGCGLREAKIAVETAYPTVLRNIAGAALENLASENARHGYGLHKYVDAREHTSALTNLEDATNGHVPF